MDCASRPPLCEDETFKRRQAQQDFIARGLRSSEDAQRTGLYYPAAAVHAELQRGLEARRAKVLGQSGL